MEEQFQLIIQVSGGYAVYNTSGTVEINDGATINIEGTYYGLSAIYNEQAGTVEINGGTINSNGSIVNCGTMTINDGIISIKTSNGKISNSSYGTLTITGGTINSEGQGIENSSNNPVTIEGGNITAKQKALTINNNILNKVSGGILTSTNGTAVYISSGSKKLTITGGTITSETGIGIENTGILTLGKDEGDYPSITVPEINGKTYGVKNTGTFNFYDGTVRGETQAIDGTVADKPDSYKVVTNETNTEAHLEISPEVDKPVILNGNNMDSLEIAMLTLSNFENKVGTIVFRKNITLTETLEIPSDVTVTFVLQGHAITYDGTDATIENNGSLTVVDYQDPTEALNAGDASVIRNTGSGVAIENNGSLTLGASGGQVNANSPVISGGVTGNAPTIYDGKVEN